MFIASLTHRKQQDRQVDQKNDIHQERARQVEGFYKLPHIYDYLLSVAATPGGQSFRQCVSK